MDQLTTNLRKIGAHMSASGGYTNALERIVKIGGNCLQLFSSSPRQWQAGQLSAEQKEVFLTAKKTLHIEPIYFHASYLINLADEGRVGAISKKLLINELNIASELSIKGTIIHLGSYKKDSLGKSLRTEEKYQLLLRNITEVLKNTPVNTLFIIENAGTKKIGETLEEIAQLIRDLNNPRVKVCLDTCHLHAAGYDLSTTKSFDRFLNRFDSLIGLSKLEVIQVNDSKDPLGSFRDRHENIGKGLIPLTVFSNLLNNPQIKDLPYILEVPGKDKKGPDNENITKLTSLIR